MDIFFSITEINWALTKDIVSIVGTIGALSIGVVGLTTWRRQLKGTSEYELAKKAVLLTFELQQSIQSVRNPMLYLRKEEVEEGRRLEEEQRIYDERLQQLYSKWAELQTIRLETKVIWGYEAHGKFDEVQKLVGKMRAEIWLHFWLKGAFAGPGATVDRSPERVQANDKIVYFTSDDDDYSQEITSAVRIIEDYFKGKIRK